MKKNPKFARQRRNRRSNSKLVIILSCIAAALLLLLVVMLMMIPKEEQPEPTTVATTEATTVATEEPTTEATTEATTVPVETEPVMLEEMAELYEQNPETVGWIKIGDTMLDYPVMFTPEDEQKYLRVNFDGEFSMTGVPYIDKDCSVDTDGANLIIYGHNMNDGTAFGTLMAYYDKAYWEQYPTISYSTLYEEREYEIIAAFPDRIYYNYEDVFKFYRFTDTTDEQAFEEAMNYYKETALYDTGVTAECGDNLITLVTCAYHHQYGRFVVVAREITEDAEEIQPTE